MIMKKYTNNKDMRNDKNHLEKHDGNNNNESNNNNKQELQRDHQICNSFEYRLSNMGSVINLKYALSNMPSDQDELQIVKYGRRSKYR